MTQPPGHEDTGADVPAAATEVPAPAQPAAPLNMAAMLSELRQAGVEVPGLPQAQPRPRPTLRIIGLVVFVLGLAALYVRGYLQQHQHFATLSIWQVIWLTLPVAAAAAFVVYQYAAGRGFAIGHLIGLVVGTAGTSYLTAISSGQQVSSSLFHFDPNCLLQNVCNSQLPTANPTTYVLKVVNNYWHVYGTSGFVSAAIIGGVIGLGLGLLNRRSAAAGRLMR
jgi:hypothetical protein